MSGRTWRHGGLCRTPYVRFNRFGLALRPLLVEALEDPQSTLVDFLPRAADAWRAIAEVSKALGQGTESGKWEGRKSSGPTVFVLAPPGSDAFQLVSRRQLGSTWGRTHEKQFYDELFELHAKTWRLDSPGLCPR